MVKSQSPGERLTHPRVEKDLMACRLQFVTVRNLVSFPSKAGVANDCDLLDKRQNNLSWLVMVSIKVSKASPQNYGLASVN